MIDTQLAGRVVLVMGSRGLPQAGSEGVQGSHYGELFDLHEDPGEMNNLWDEPGAAALKTRLLHAFLQAELQREPTRMPRVTGA